ncbi:MFS transporter [Nonomuraea angiospora]|uniref:MFS transporter n=1 Tax=Nonomuraea angiospora TaxID=46172 RepID=UPI0037AC011B
MKAPVRNPSLFRQRDFALLWSGQTVSLFGTQFTYVALPLTAVVVLDATPMESGILSALTTLPFLLFGLAVGVLLDRRSRRPILIGADVVRALALFWVPVAYFLGVLSIAQLFVVAFVVGTMTVFFDLAYQSYLPNLVGREKLMEANSKLQVSESLAEVGGPGAAGALISVLGAPLVVAADALSYVVSTLAVSRLPADASPVEPSRTGPSVWTSIREGVSVVARHHILRWCTTTAVLANLFEGTLMAVFFLFLARENMIGSAGIGLVVASGGVGGLCGALLVDTLTRRFGVGPMLVLSMVLPGAGYLLLATAHGNSWWAVGTAAAANFITLLGLPIFNVTVISLRQAVTPDQLLGRVNATVRTCAWGALSLGSVIGGALGSAFGLRETVLVAAGGAFSAALLLLASPVRAVRRLDGAGAVAAVSGTSEPRDTPGENP